MGKIKVLICHGQQIYCDGLSRLLMDEADIEIVGKAPDGEKAISMAKELNPDVAIIHIVIPKLYGIETARQITRDCPGTASLILSGYNYGENLLPSLRAGALGY